MSIEDLQKFVGEIEALDEKIAALNKKKSEIYKRAGRAQLDRVALREVILIRRKHGEQTFYARSVTVAKYLEALGHTHAAASEITTLKRAA